MNKKILIILIAIFLVTSVGVISAADDSLSIPVKIVWTGEGDIPDSVTVNLIKDGKVVDKATLNEKNSWNTTFKVDDDGNYEVQEQISGDYSHKISGNAKKGFVITNVLKEDAIGVSEEDTVAEDTSGDDVIDVPDNESAAGDASIDDEPIAEPSDDIPAGGNGTGDSNSTDNSTDSNSTDNATDDTTDGATDDASDDVDDGSDNDTKDEVTTTTKTTTTTKIIKQEKKPVNTTNNHKKTGFPIVILVIAVFVAAFIPLSRRK